MTVAVCLGVLLLFAVGLIRCWNSVRDWVATHAAWEQGDRKIVEYVEQLAAKEGVGTVQPGTLTLGLSAPLYHYTQWPVKELYFADPATTTEFLSGPELHLAVVPEESLVGQWADTPTGKNWRWLKTNYDLEPVGQEGAYTVYVIRKPAELPVP